jgi:hypothetical protein
MVKWNPHCWLGRHRTGGGNGDLISKMAQKAAGGPFVSFREQVTH